MYFTLSKIRHAMLLRDVSSAHVSVLKCSIEEKAYEYRRASISIALSGDSSGVWASLKATLEGPLARPVLKTHEKTFLVNERHSFRHSAKAGRSMPMKRKKLIRVCLVFKKDYRDLASWEFIIQSFMNKNISSIVFTDPRLADHVQRILSSAFTFEEKRHSSFLRLAEKTWPEIFKSPISILPRACRLVTGRRVWKNIWFVCVPVRASRCHEKVPYHFGVTHLDDNKFLSFNATDSVLLLNAAGKKLSSTKKLKGFSLQDRFLCCLRVQPRHPKRFRPGLSVAWFPVCGGIVRRLPEKAACSNEVLESISRIHNLIRDRGVCLWWQINQRNVWGLLPQTAEAGKQLHRF